MLPLKALAEGGHPALPLVAPGGPWLVAASLPSLPPFSLGLSSVLCLSSSVFYKDTPVLGFRAHPVNPA